MIRIHILLDHSSGVTQTIATGRISNAGNGTDELGDYVAEFKLRADMGTLDEWVECSVEEFPRLEKNVWELLHAALTTATIKAAADKLGV